MGIFKIDMRLRVTRIKTSEMKPRVTKLVKKVGEEFKIHRHENPSLNGLSKPPAALTTTNRTTGHGITSSA